MFVFALLGLCGSFELVGNNGMGRSGASSESVGSGGGLRSYSAFFSWSAHLRLWGLALLGFFADYFSKAWAVDSLSGNGEGSLSVVRRCVVVIEDYVVFRLVHNSGAVAGFASGKTGFLIAASLVALGFLFWLFVSSRREQWFGHISLGLLFGGALGNMWDRIFNDGRVIDFIEVDLGFWPCNPWPTFNVADVLLCVGVGLLIVSMWRSRGTAVPGGSTRS